MIEISHVETYGWEAAIRGMRNPMNSWEKSDTLFIDNDGECHNICGDGGPYIGNPSFASQGFELGDNDLKLMKNLVASGTDHAKFMRMIGISLDIVAPLYWWKEMDTYRVGIAPNPTDIEYNSCSTMHKITAKEFVLDDFSSEHLIGDQPIPGTCISPAQVLGQHIRFLNRIREMYLETNDKTWWWQLIQLLPTSYNQRRTMTLNYAAARKMYHARKNHKQDEWRHLCKELEQLPYAKELIVE